MAQTPDIQYIRRLVEKFYQAETSPTEEGILAEYFNETNRHNIPEDLAKDAEVFRSLNSLLPEADEIKIPENLESRLAEITNVIPEKEGVRKFRIAPFILKAASITAAACLIWGLFFNDGELPAPSTNENLIAEVETQPMVRQSDTTAVEIPTAVVNPIQKETPRRIVHCKPKAQSQIATVPRDFVDDPQEDGFIEITDPEEARQIMENIGNLLAANFSESDKAISTVSASLESYKEITKTILQ